MPRLVNGERKITNPKPENAGKLLIFCEGYTEYNYLDYFRSYIDNNLHAKYSGSNCFNESFRKQLYIGLFKFIVWDMVGYAFPELRTG